MTRREISFSPGSVPPIDGQSRLVSTELRAERTRFNWSAQQSQPFVDPAWPIQDLRGRFFGRTSFLRPGKTLIKTLPVPLPFYGLREKERESYHERGAARRLCPDESTAAYPLSLWLCLRGIIAEPFPSIPCTLMKEFFFYFLRTSLKMAGWFESGVENVPPVAKFNVYTKGENLGPFATWLVRLENFFWGNFWERIFYQREKINF